MDITHKKLISVIEIIFTLAYGFYLLICFYGTTMFMEKAYISSLIYTVVRLLILGCAFAMIVITRRKFSVIQLVSTAIMGLLMLLIVFSTGYTTLIDLYAICLFLFFIKPRIVFEIFTISMFCFMGITILACAFGIIKNIGFNQSEHIRYAFGFIYPTDFAAHCLYLLLSYYVIKKRKISFMDIVACIIIAYLLYSFSFARLDSILIILSIILFVIFQAKPTLIHSKVVKALFIFSFPVMLVLSILLVFNYNPSNLIFKSINLLINNRLDQAYIGWNKYGLSLFGKAIKMQGYGWSAAGFDNELGYFFIDNGYIQTLLCYGVLFTFIITICVIIVQRYYINKGNWKLCLALFIISVSNLIDCRYLAIAYSPFFFLFLYPFMCGEFFRMNSFARSVEK